MYRPASRRVVKYVPIFGVLALGLLMSASLRAADPAANVPAAPDAAAPEAPDDEATSPTPSSPNPPATTTPANPKDDLAAPPAIEVQKPEPEAEAQEPVHKKRGKTYEDEYGKTSGLLGPLTFGPSITLLALTRPFAAGLEFKYLDLFGFAGYYSFMPQVHFRSTDVKYHAWDARFRWYVFRGAFFLGAALGQQNLTGTDSDDFSSTTGIPGSIFTATLNMKTTFVVPHVGWNWEWQSGFFMGMDLGVQLTMSESNTVTSDAPAEDQATQQYINLSNKVTNDANKIGKIPLPMITFIKLGWMF